MSLVLKTIEHVTTIILDLDIQISVNNILRENKGIHNEMEELKSTVSRQTIEISTLKTQLEKTSKQYQEAEKQLNAAKR